MLTKDQEKEIEDIYTYTEKAAFTDKEVQIAREMFDTPEKFQILRKILQFYTPDERGLTIKDPQSFVQADITDLNAYAIETAVNHLANEKIKQSLFGFYRLLRNKIVEDKTKEFEINNAIKEDEAKKKEEFEKKKAKENNQLGPNL